MVNVDKQIGYWRDGAEDDFSVALQLIESGRIRQGLFFVHITIEKILKAHVCRQIRNIAPRSHNLIRLAELGQVDLADEQKNALAEINAFNLEGRYPESITMTPSSSEARRYLAIAGEILRCLMKQL